MLLFRTWEMQNVLIGMKIVILQDYQPIEHKHHEELHSSSDIATEAWYLLMMNSYWPWGTYLLLLLIWRWAIHYAILQGGYQTYGPPKGPLQSVKIPEKYFNYSQYSKFKGLLCCVRCNYRLNVEKNKIIKLKWVWPPPSFPPSDW